MSSEPLAYFISFHTYGTWLHGDDKGSVDRRRNTYGRPFVTPDRKRVEGSRDRMASNPFRFDDVARWIVCDAVKRVSSHRVWRLLAMNVRTNHVHIVISAPLHSPERVMNDLKSWSTRRLREHRVVTATDRIWSRHGSTEYLWKEEQVAGACDYVLHRQGAPLPMRPPPSIPAE